MNVSYSTTDARYVRAMNSKFWIARIKLCTAITQSNAFARTFKSMTRKWKSHETETEGSFFFHESTRILRFVGKGHELIEIEISSSWKRACRHLMLFTHLDKSGRYSRQASELICWFSLIGKFRERRRGCNERIRGTRVEFIRACGSTCWILVVVAERLRVYVRSVHTRKCLAAGSHSSAAC